MAFTLTSQPVGRSALGTEIFCLAAPERRPKLLIMSGLHGDEIEGIVHCNQLINILASESPDTLEHIAFMPIANPDAFTHYQRWTSSHVDLNRNFATSDWTPHFENPRYPPGPKAASEIEARAISEFVKTRDFEFVLDLHSFKETALLPLFLKSETRFDTLLAEYGRSANIPVYLDQDALGYKFTGGGFHTLCFENGINNLTLEIEKGLGQFAIRDRYLPASTAFVRGVVDRIKQSVQ
jgi:murein peptide amidase A